MSIQLDIEQETVSLLVDLIWPGETDECRGLALAEEAGEVARAILKREHARRGEGDRNKERDWTENLRKELSQVVVVAMSIAQHEGFSLGDAVLEEINALDARREALGLEWSHVPVKPLMVPKVRFDGTPLGTCDYGDDTRRATDTQGHPHYGNCINWMPIMVPAT